MSIGRLSCISELSNLTSEATLSGSIEYHVRHITGIKHSSSELSSILENESTLRWMAFATVRAPWFDSVIGAIVAINAVCIGIELQMSLSGEVPMSLQVMESVFLSIYVLELMLRLFADGRVKFTQTVFLFDLGLVVTGVLAKVAEVVGAKGFDSIDLLLVFRSLRVFRVVRAIRMLEFFSELWKLFTGLLRSARTVFAAFLLIFLVMYMFACIGVEAITKSEALRGDEDTRPIIEEFFDSVFSIMLMLIQFATADSISPIYVPIVKKQPALAIYFVSLVLVITVLCMNLVTAAIVESAIRTGKDDQDLILQRIRNHTRRYMPVLKRVFQEIDTTGEGTLSYRELEDSIEAFNELHLPEALAKILEPCTLKNAFELMDDDEDGKVDLTEFVRGVFGLAYMEVPIETTHMLEMLRRQSRSVHEITEQGRELQTRVRIISESIDTLQGSIK